MILLTHQLMKYRLSYKMVVTASFLLHITLLNLDVKSLSMYSYVFRNWKCLISDHHAFDHLKPNPSLAFIYPKIFQLNNKIL